MPKRRRKKKEKEREWGTLRLHWGSTRNWSDVGGIEAVEVVTDVGHIICRYQAGEGDKNACGEELHG